MELPLMLGSKMVLQDIWEPGVGLARIQDEGVNFMMAATPFLADLTDHSALDKYDISTLDIFISAGAPIPRTRAERDRAAQGAYRVWLGHDREPARHHHAAARSAGQSVRNRRPASAGHGDSGGRCCRAGAGRGPGGELQSKGPSNFVGYLKRPKRFDTDEEGWFKTGDMARIDADGYVRITGRSKDIIIRGGENVPVVEVEQMLHRHPAIQKVAVVGVPDAHLGERAVAYVTLRPGHSFTLEQMKQFLEEQRMTKQYWPETLIVLDELPHTPTGKIQKFRLREMAREQCKPV